MKKLFLVFIGIILIIIAFFAIIVAKSGLVEIPLLTDVFYEDPLPTRNVEPISSYNVERIFANEIQNYVLAHPSAQELNLNVPLSEEGFTYLINDAFKDSFIVNPQIVFDPEYIEFYGSLKGVRSKILVHLYPEIKEGNVELTFKKIRLGNLNIPLGIGNLVADKFLKETLEKNLQVMIADSQLFSLKLKDGVIIFNFLADKSKIIK